MAGDKGNRRGRQKRLHRKRREQGLCYRCGQRRPELGKSQCGECLDYLRSYRKTNKPAAQATARRWYEEHRDLTVQRARASEQRDPEKAASAKKRWKRDHPLQWRKDNAVRRARLRNAAFEGNVDYAAVLERDGLFCYLCERDVEPEALHFDHVVPLSRGGSHVSGNLKVTHSICNLRKGSKLLEELNLHEFENMTADEVF